MVSNRFLRKIYPFVLGVPPIIVIALGYYFSAVELIYELEVFFSTAQKFIPPRDITPVSTTVSSGRTFVLPVLFQALSHSQTSRRRYPLVYLYPATNASRQWQIGSRFFLHSRNFMYYPDHSCTYYFCSKKLQKERCTNGEG